MSVLYPLKFKPFYLDKIWGGEKIKTILNKDFGEIPNCGESWEISGYDGYISVVTNGFLAGNNIEELIEVYMGDLVGEKIYDKFGLQFPLLVKFIDAHQDLSIQVHPGNEMAKQRHSAYGKTEMWYVIDADEGSELISGFNREMDKKKYLERLENGTLDSILNYEQVKPGDAFFIPAGRVHAIGKGILLTEIQQTSDVTYRIYDFGRKDANGNVRELHTDLALDAIDFKYYGKYKTEYSVQPNASSEIITCPYFTTNIIQFDKEIEKEYVELDSFIIYICLEGEFLIQYDNGSELVKKGEIVLIPASFNSIFLKPLSKKVKTLEVYIKETS
ncbi:Mannose-6-phosphate isomerase [hydrothermal vent metagenome]|uniref:Mannose-6-phosphate isomerase n=1 Tax=hydrothermal vent metagenome TaxID=652676 RepID=A0A3B0UQA9_9ZZZZ